MLIRAHTIVVITPLHVLQTMSRKISKLPLLERVCLQIQSIIYVLLSRIRKNNRRFHHIDTIRH